MNTNKKSLLQVILLVLIVINMAATVFLLVKTNQNETASDSIKYTLYIGLNDKETYEQEITAADAKEIITSVCMQYLDGYTVQVARGMWIDENGNDTHENTVVCYIYDTSDETVHKIADELLVKLNQNSILIEKNETAHEYYSGLQN